MRSTPWPPPPSLQAVARSLLARSHTYITPASLKRALDAHSAAFQGAFQQVCGSFDVHGRWPGAVLAAASAAGQSCTLSLGHVPVLLCSSASLPFCVTGLCTQDAHELFCGLLDLLQSEVLAREVGSWWRCTACMLPPVAGTSRSWVCGTIMQLCWPHNQQPSPVPLKQLSQFAVQVRRLGRPQVRISETADPAARNFSFAVSTAGGLSCVPCSGGTGATLWCSCVAVGFVSGDAPLAT